MGIVTNARIADGARLAFGVTTANTILLVDGLFRPGSVDFSLAFLVAPSLALVWTITSNPIPAERRSCSG